MPPQKQQSSTYRKGMRIR